MSTDDDAPASLPRSLALELLLVCVLAVAVGAVIVRCYS